MTLGNIFLVNLTSGLLQCILHVLDFPLFDIFNIKRIQNLTSFLWTFYVRYHFKVLRFCTHLCFPLYFKYSHVSRKWKDCCMINTWDKLWIVVLLLWIAFRGLIFFFFSTWVFFHEHSRFTGQQRKGEAISLSPLYHFHPLHRHLDISRRLLHIAGSWTRTGDLWFPRASR